jgi:hypothetical protein
MSNMLVSSRMSDYFNKEEKENCKIIVDELAGRPTWERPHQSHCPASDFRRKNQYWCFQGQGFEKIRAHPGSGWRRVEQPIGYSFS